MSIFTFTTLVLDRSEQPVFEDQEVVLPPCLIQLQQDTARLHEMQGLLGDMTIGSLIDEERILDEVKSALNVASGDMLGDNDDFDVTFCQHRNGRYLRYNRTLPLCGQLAPFVSYTASATTAEENERLLSGRSICESPGISDDDEDEEDEETAEQRLLAFMLNGAVQNEELSVRALATDLAWEKNVANLPESPMSCFSESFGFPHENSSQYSTVYTPRCANEISYPFSPADRTERCPTSTAEDEVAGLDPFMLNSVIQGLGEWKCETTGEVTQTEYSREERSWERSCGFFMS